MPFCGRDVEHIGIDVAVIEPGEADGMRLARSLRAQRVPVLFTSIYPPDEHVLEIEPVAYLVKPFPLYALERALESALAGIETPAVLPAAVVAQ